MRLKSQRYTKVQTLAPLIVLLCPYLHGLPCCNLECLLWLFVHWAQVDAVKELHTLILQPRATHIHKIYIRTHYGVIIGTETAKSNIMEGDRTTHRNFNRPVHFILGTNCNILEY